MTSGPARPHGSQAREGVRVTPRGVPPDIGLFVAMMALLIPLRILHTSHIRWMSIDGGYYTEVARHVRDGLGLTTNVSLYHMGYESFPHPTCVYPLWPWILGMGARVVDLPTLAHWLPMCFSFTAVIGAFLFGRRLWPEPMFPVNLPGFHAGHLFALMLAVHSEFITFTSIPYTEGLAWTLTFLFLWRLVGKGASLDLRWAVEAGLWLGVVYFVRAQLIVIALCCAAAWLLRLLVGPDRGRVALHGAVTFGVTSLLLGGWWMHIRTFVHDAGLLSLLRFDQNRANDLLEPIDVMVNSETLVDLVVDRLSSLTIAWDIQSSSSYQEVIYTLHWALPAALPLLAASALGFARRGGVRGVLDRLRRPTSVPWISLLVFAVGAFLSVHLVHKHYNGEFYFARRQGMLSLPLFMLCLGWLLRQGRPLPTVVGVLILASSAVLGTHEIISQATKESGELRGADAQEELVTWLRAREEAEEGLVVAIDADLAQRVAWRTEGIGYHWIEQQTSYADLRTITDRLGARYLVIGKGGVKDWRLYSEAAGRLDTEFVRVADEPDGNIIWARRTGVSSPATP